MDNFDSAGAIVPGAEAEEPLNGKHENSRGFCTVGNLLKDDDCDFGLDPMTIIPRMKLRDANYVVMQAVKEGHQRFEIREEVNPETKLKIYLDSPPISYSAKPFSDS